jgi:hypothetical protein
MAVKVPPLLHKMSASAQKAWYKKHGMEMPAKERSAAQAKRIKVEPKKTEPVSAPANKEKTTREVNAERQKAYYAKGGRAPIGAGGSGGHSSMAGSNMSTVKGVVAGIKAGVNPKVSLDPYESEKAKKTGPRSLKLKKESVDEALSPERKRMFDLKLKLIKKAANRKDRAKPSKVHEPRTSLNPAADMKLHPKPMDTRTWDYIMKNEEASPMIKPPTNRFDKKSDAFAHVEKHGGKVYKQTYTDSKGQQTVSYSVKKEEVELDEVTKQEAEKILGGEVKEKPKMAPGKQPAGYRYVRGLARRAMKGQVDAVHRSMEKTMKKEEVEVTEAIKGAADVGEYDYEGDMAKSQLRSILANAKRMHDMLEENTNLPEWVQSKITLAEDYIVTAANYMEGEMNEEVEQIDELKKSTLASYVNKAANQVRAKSGIAASFETQGARKRNPENKTAYWDVAQDYRKGARKRLTGIEKATAKLAKEEVEQVEEKYENNPLHSMPRPNKAVGLKPSQLAKKPAMAAEAAEGSTPTTPKEKALAAHHGDPKKITYGDVIKARLKSAAAKKMGK